MTHVCFDFLAVIRPDCAGGAALELRDVTVRYRPELPTALAGVTLAVPAGAKVGVVGRSGGGKSTLVQALLRLVPVESGAVLVRRASCAVSEGYRRDTECALGSDTR